MTVENISWSISTKECCRPRRGLNPRPPGLQSEGASNWATEAGHKNMAQNFMHSISSSIFLKTNLMKHQVTFSMKNKKINAVYICHENTQGYDNDLVFYVTFNIICHIETMEMSLWNALCNEARYTHRRPRWRSWMRVRLETRRSRVRPPPRSATFFRGDWSWNIFYGHSLPSADSRRAVVSFWRKNVHNTG